MAREMEHAELLADNGFKADLTARIAAQVLTRLAGTDGEDDR